MSNDERAASVMRGQIGAVTAQYLAWPTSELELRDHVTAIAGYDEAARGEVARAELPRVGVVLVLELEPSVMVEGARPNFPYGFVAGVGGQLLATRFVGQQRGMQVDLTPLGNRSILGVDGDELAGRVVPFEEVRPEAVSLAERVRTAPDWQGHFEVVYDWLIQRIGQSSGDLRLARWLCGSIRASSGLVSVGELSRCSGYSAGYLRRAAVTVLEPGTSGQWQVTLQAGDMYVVPAQHWHRQRAISLPSLRRSCRGERRSWHSQRAISLPSLRRSCRGERRSWHSQRAISLPSLRRSCRGERRSWHSQRAISLPSLRRSCRGERRSWHSQSTGRPTTLMFVSSKEGNDVSEAEDPRNDDNDGAEKH